MADTQLTDDILPPGYHGCRSQMQRARRQHQLAPPKDRHSGDLSGAWSQTNANQSFILYQDNYMLIFTTDENLKILAALDIMYMDGTFKFSPHLYQQMYSLHGSYRDHVVPLVYTLLSTKSRQSHHTMFSKVHDRMAELDLVFNPATIFSDFGSVIITAMRHLFPASQHRGCYFHHTQAVWRQVQTIGLQTAYEMEHEIRRSVRSLMALAFLSIIAVRPAFDTLRQKPVVQRNTTHGSQ